MVDILQEYVDENALNRKNILKYIDDYSIYSFYIDAELELKVKYSSPLRLGDDDPSFSLYYSKYQEDTIMFKDQSTGVFGNVFDFVRELMKNGDIESPSRKQVFAQINSDLALGLDGTEVGEFNPKIIKKRPVKRAPTKIGITSRAKESYPYTKYWDFLEIPKNIRDDYFFRDVEIIHFITEVHKTVTPKSMATSYEILGEYKIYQPHEEKQFKFRNNYSDYVVEGALQLKFNQDFAIITKSMKECAFFRAHFDWEGVAGKSENTMITPYFMNNVLKGKYKKVFIWLDNDEAGIRAQERYLEEYPWLIPITVHDSVLEKDPTDMFTAAKKRGIKKAALHYIKTLILNK